MITITRIFTSDMGETFYDEFTFDCENENAAWEIYDEEVGQYPAYVSGNTNRSDH